MRHGVAGYKLTRDTDHRRAMRRNLAAALFQHGQITTTLPKAKSVKPFVEKLITLARKGDLASRRRAIALLQDRELIHVVKGGAEPDLIEDKTLIQKLFSEIAPKYTDRPGGYTRIIRLSTHRIGDGSDLVVLQLVGEESGPNVSGKYSRRRQKQNKRAEFAAKLRKSPGKKSEESASAEASAEPATATAEPEAPVETEVPAESASAKGSEEQPKSE